LPEIGISNSRNANAEDRHFKQQKDFFLLSCVYKFQCSSVYYWSSLVEDHCFMLQIKTAATEEYISSCSFLQTDMFYT